MNGARLVIVRWRGWLGNDRSNYFRMFRGGEIGLVIETLSTVLVLLLTFILLSLETCLANGLLKLFSLDGFD